MFSKTSKGMKKSWKKDKLKKLSELWTYVIVSVWTNYVISVQSFLYKPQVVTVAPLVNSLIFNHLTLNFPQYFFDLYLIRIRKKIYQNDGIFLMTSSFVQWWWYVHKNVFWSKIYFGALTNSLIFNHLTSNFPQYFFDISLIRIRKKKNQNGGKFLMTSWQNYAVTSWQVAIWRKKFRQIDPI